jgi:hypothetical protein
LTNPPFPPYPYLISIFRRSNRAWTAAKWRVKKCLPPRRSRKKMK